MATPQNHERRSELLSTARDIIREDGMHGFSLRGLARKVGLSAPSLYEYFSSVDEIYSAIRVLEEEGLSEQLSQATCQESNPVARVRKIIAAYISYFDGRPDRLDILFRHSKTQRSSLDMKPEAGSSYDQLVEAMKALFTHTAPSNEVAEELAFTAWAYAHGACELRVRFLESSSIDLDALIETGIETLVAGICERVTEPSDGADHQLTS